MTTERVFPMPDLGEGLDEGEIVAWMVREGDRVALNQPIVEVETAKATVEIPSPFVGVVARLHGAVGDALPVGAPLVTVEVESDASTDEAASTDVAPDRVAATPPVRKLARALGVDLTTATGTGPDGRITAEDVRAVEGGPEDGAPAPHAPARRAIAEALTRQASIPQVTTFRTLDCGELEPFRAALGVSPLPVVAAALCRTIARHPALNSAWSADGIAVSDAIHLGIAADTDRGLVVPVVRNAQLRGISALRDEIRRLAQGARDGSLSPEDLVGATIAISNTGSYGSEAGTPILAPGTGVTLAIGAIEPRALVVDGLVEARSACTLSCTFDHRILDGAAVGRALTDLVAILTDRAGLGDLPR